MTPTTPRSGPSAPLGGPSAPPATTAPTPADDAVAGRRRWASWPGRTRLAGGAALVILGAMLPWVMTPLGNVRGLSGAGLWTLYAGLFAGGGAALPWPRLAAWHAPVLAAAAIGLPAWQLARLAWISATTDAWGAALPGVGLVVTLAGGVLAVGAFRRRPRRPGG